MWPEKAMPPLWAAMGHQHALGDAGGVLVVDALDVEAR